jgi:hypothetical protein
MYHPECRLTRIRLTITMACIAAQNQASWLGVNACAVDQVVKSRFTRSGYRDTALRIMVAFLFGKAVDNRVTILWVSLQCLWSIRYFVFRSVATHSCRAPGQPSSSSFFLTGTHGLAAIQERWWFGSWNPSSPDPETCSLQDPALQWEAGCAKSVLQQT